MMMQDQVACSGRARRAFFDIDAANSSPIVSGAVERASFSSFFVPTLQCG
jgi:hypothetical protein